MTMEKPEIHLRCLELAMAQAKNEGQHGNIDRVVEIETRFYTLVIEALVACSDPPKEPSKSPEPRSPKPKADKSPEIFK